MKTSPFAHLGMLFIYAHKEIFCYKHVSVGPWGLVQVSIPSHVAWLVGNLGVHLSQFLLCTTVYITNQSRGGGGGVAGSTPPHMLRKKYVKPMSLGPWPGTRSSTDAAMTHYSSPMARTPALWTTSSLSCWSLGRHWKTSHT